MKAIKAEAVRYMQMGEWKCPVDGEVLPMYMDERIVTHLVNCAPKQDQPVEAEVVEDAQNEEPAAEDHGVQEVRGDAGGS